jgi:hypothetical protein
LSVGTHCALTSIESSSETTDYDPLRALVGGLADSIADAEQEL